MGIARKNRVDITSMLTAVSSKPSGSDRVHSFNALDNAMSPHTVHVIFYYARSPFGSFDLDSVRIPLSELLSLYPPVVGRVAENPDRIWEVKCNDAGLRVLRAKVCVSIDEWLRSADGHEERDLTAWEEMPEDPSTWSPFRLQINEFDGGGMAIGLSCPHRQADPTTLTVLLKSWTEAQRRHCIIHPPSFSPLPSNLTDTDAVRSNYEPIPGPISSKRKTATATFRFSSSALKRCLDVYSIDGIFPKATPFDVFAALFWTRVALVKQRSDRVCICVDFRRLLPKPLPYGFFGNALNFSSLEMTDVVDQGVGHVARLINDHVTSLDVEKIRSDLNRAGGAAKGQRMYGGDLTIVSMEHMLVEGEPLMYEAVFTDGVRPVHVSYRIENDGGEGVIMVMPSPEKGFGRVVAVTLPEEEMLMLLADQEILGLEPEIILSGVK